MKKKIKKIIFAPDLHYPLIDEISWSILKEFIEDFQPDVFIFGGDQLDMGSISIFNKGKPKLLENKRLKEDYKGFQKDILDVLEDILPNKCENVWLNGNHENRIERLIESDPQYEGFIELENNLDLDDWDIKDYNDYYMIGNMVFIHGYRYNKYFARYNLFDYNENIFSGHVHCFDDETELLTSKGWRKYTEIEKGDRCLTLNKDTKLLEWNEINEKAVHDHDGDMVRIKSPSVDLLVDDEHGLLCTHTKNATSIVEMKAKDILNKTSIGFISAGMMAEDNEEYDISDDMLRLLAWVISEGSIYIDKRSTSHREVCIFQSEEEHLNTIETLLDGLNIDYRKSKKDKSEHSILQPYRFRIKSKDSRMISSLLNDDKHNIPSWMYELSNRQFNIFLEEYIKGDGHDYKTKQGEKHIYSIDESIIDYFQYMLFINGYRNKVYWKNGSFNNSKLCGQINIDNHMVSWIDNRRKNNHKPACTLVPYKGKKWCVNVDNGTLVVRRNNRITITQNSKQEFVKCSPIDGTPKIGVGVPCLCDTNPEWKRGRPNSWVNGFLFAYVFPDGNFSYYTPIITKDGCIIEGKHYK